jgi:signal transduction histidine kinase
MEVYADGKMLKSILQNIISNALRHSLQEGTIAISSEIKEKKAIICIRDTGTGMPAEVLENIFSPQLNLLSNAHNDNRRGGIGLLLVKGFVERSGGEIWAESTEGKGSSFYFTLPVSIP